MILGRIGKRSLPIVAAALGVCAPGASADMFTTPGQSTFVVPAGIHRVSAMVIGAAGGGGAGGATGGKGGTASGELNVTPGETLFVEIGSIGGMGTATDAGTAGQNGGGAGGGGATSNAGGGGGASDVRTASAASPGTLGSRLVVGGGGGGGGGAGGAGGKDASSDPKGSTAGSATGGSANAAAPGQGGQGMPSNAPPGSEGQGGQGKNGNGPPGATSPGGGGGGGEFGGGGGVNSNFNTTAASGGGGGSDFLAASVIGGMEGVNTGPGNPSVTINPVPAPVATFNPKALSFGSVQLGRVSPSSTVTVTNVGLLPLHVSGASTSGADAGDFTVSAGGCAAALDPGDNCALVVRFTPTASGARSAALSLQSDSAGAPPPVALSGTGAAAPPRLSRFHGKPTTFRAARRGGSTAKRGGMLVTFADSLASTTTFTVTTTSPGIRSGRRCRVPHRGQHVPRSRGCTLTVKLGSFQIHDRAGANSFHFTGRAGGKTLHAGNYSLSATPRLGGRSGKAISVAFRIKP